MRNGITPLGSRAIPGNGAGREEREQRQKGSFDGKLRSELGENRGHD